MPFQGTINIQPAVAVAGDFASADPWASVLSGSGKFVAGAAGLSQGIFAWHDPANDALLNNFGAGLPAGFIHRDQTQLITTYLAEFGGLMQPGQEVSAMRAGAFWAKNETGGNVSRGQKVYVANGSGKVVATGVTGLTIAGASFTGVIAANVLTTSAVTGPIDPYSTIAGSGVTAGSTLKGQLTGTPGGAGTYTVVGTTTASSTAMTSTGATETKWSVGSAAANGELFKMSSASEG